MEQNIAIFNAILMIIFVAFILVLCINFQISNRRLSKEKGLLTKELADATRFKNLTDYSTYDSDFKYLNHIIDREKMLALNYVLSPLQVQYDDKITIKDDDVQTIVANASSGVLKYLGEEYENYLILKYFDTNEALIKYIVEEIQIYITGQAIVKNFDRAKRVLSKNLQEDIFAMNLASKEN